MVLPEAEALGGKTLFVTGADGFIGSHLADACVEAGADVHAFVRKTSAGSLNNLDRVRDRITVHEGDITDMHSVRQALAEPAWRRVSSTTQLAVLHQPRWAFQLLCIKDVIRPAE